MSLVRVGPIAIYYFSAVYVWDFKEMGFSLRGSNIHTWYLLFIVSLFLVCCGERPPPEFSGAYNSNNTQFSEYYASLKVKSGNSFRESLTQHISNHEYISNRDIWQYLEFSHRPIDDPRSIILFYTRREISAENKASAKNQANNDYWNREHVWPQSYGLKKTFARFDIHNIVPVDRSVNSSRGNKFFDEGGEPHYECVGCLADKDSWEPPDIVKGDVARILFYMDLRYDGGRHSEMKDLTLNWTNSEILYSWHCIDPVSSHEKYKNNVAHAYQGNRNPFIDHPKWVDYFYNVDCNAELATR